MKKCVEEALRVLHCESILEFGFGSDVDDDENADEDVNEII